MAGLVVGIRLTSTLPGFTPAYVVLFLTCLSPMAYESLALRAFNKSPTTGV